MEKTITVRRTSITFSLWDLGGQREFVNMLPLVCNDAVAILFMFDLSRKSTLNSVKEWYRQARGFNKVSIYAPILCTYPRAFLEPWADPPCWEKLCAREGFCLACQNESISIHQSGVVSGPGAVYSELADRRSK